jgi:alginate O-acetyltransferase complex protein AlgI
MLFCTLPFLAFFVVVFVAYWLTPWPRARVWLLLGASFYFYSCWSAQLAWLVVATSVFDFLAARAIDAIERPRLRKALWLGSLAVNLSVLLYFKYANFFLDSLAQSLRLVGFRVNWPLLQVLVPVGISFYTFEAISYTTDVYFRRIRAERNLANFLLFILFFPHLVAGPIVRGRDFLPQTRRAKRFSMLRFQVGVQLVLLGLVKKLVIADRMGLLVDPVFADPGDYATSVLWIASFAYAMQIYCDFSGYSDLALGTAHLLGYHLTQNFNLPYISANVAELWRRWHISLSSWLRDYVFFPLGGSRGSNLRTACNLLAVMTLCGLWHGAAWNTVAWGFFHGCCLVVHRAFRAWIAPQPRWNAVLLSGPGTLVRIALTFATFVLGLLIFRNPTFASCGVYLARMAWPHDGLPCPVPEMSFWLVAGVFVAAHLVAAKLDWQRLWGNLPSPVRGFAYASCLILTMVLAPVVTRQFVYFQF